MLPSGAFFSLRCLIYKVHTTWCWTLLIITCCLSLVKNFFQVFSQVSDVFCHRQQLLHLTTSCGRCQELFSNPFSSPTTCRRQQLFKFSTRSGHCQDLFSDDSTPWPRLAPLVCSLSASLADSLVRIPRFSSVVKNFFSFSCVLFHLCFLLKFVSKW